jgi:2-polyprenyl-3-methyl-5-hydroxy-6-metoxy-1,4-benzoquinol methylase
LREVYSKDYFRNDHSEVTGYEDYERDRYCILKTANRRLDVIGKYRRRPGRLLDVGCAYGFFLEAARKRGWDVDGIDISEHAVAYARDHLGLPAKAGVLEEAGYEPASFDVITAWDVVEHFPDPLRELQYLYTLLKPGGLLVLSTPDVGSPVARITGHRWMGFKLAEEHLYYFSRETIVEMLEEAGFDRTRTFHVGKDVALEFFARRLSLYVPPAAKAVDRAVAGLGLGRASVYVNPRDIIGVVAKKPRL